MVDTNKSPTNKSDQSSAEPSVCKYFQKGNCRFGAKCALAHILPDGRRVNGKPAKPVRARTSTSSFSSDSGDQWTRPKQGQYTPQLTQSIWSSSSVGSGKGFGSSFYTSVSTVNDTAVESDDNMDSMEDFVPGSLSDLLTAEELRRRSKPTEDTIVDRSEFTEFRNRMERLERTGHTEHGVWEMQFVMDIVLDLLVGVVEPVLLQSLLLFLKSLQLSADVRVQKVVHVAAVQDLRHHVVLPLVVVQKILVLQVDVVNTGTPIFGLDVTCKTPSVRIGWVVAGHLLGSLGHKRSTLDVVSGLRSGNVDLVQHVVHSGGSLELLLDSRREQLLTGLVSHPHHVLLVVAGRLHDLDSRHLQHGFQQSSLRLIHVIHADDVRLVHHHKHRLVGKQRLDRVEQLDLGLDAETTLLRKIHEIQDTRPQMRNRIDTLHLDVVHLLCRTVQDTRGVNGLETQVLVVEMTHVQRLGGERVRLHLDVGLGDASEETGLTNVGVTAN
ncbi:hypothetical protein OGAPHI_006821 [Ogataea philodendri]|uniref:C3H1-type domain-containing protein n=1 Tax=Ogataea philodendri TaxID=1378263 RepID=A0A9P8T0Q4_9ASCO|nr:uncharacterized protein OGAPHI_006821 [Ogataea philodendri]KAH3661414.1 hypothetical protein OGAPHI_006821 [Ogataea philodendri]